MDLERLEGVRLIVYIVSIDYTSQRDSEEIFVGNISNIKNREKESGIVVGASLSGLMTGISLAREGLHVTILDKVSEKQRHGSGLQVDGGTMEMSKTARLLRKLASGGKTSVQLWSSIEHRLRKEALSDSKINIR